MGLHPFGARVPAQLFPLVWRHDADKRARTVRQNQSANRDRRRTAGNQLERTGLAAFVRVARLAPWIASAHRSNACTKKMPMSSRNKTPADYLMRGLWCGDLIFFGRGPLGAPGRSHTAYSAVTPRHTKSNECVLRLGHLARASR